jgi:LPS-assembly lipoprotein
LLSRREARARERARARAFRLHPSALRDEWGQRPARRDRGGHYLAEELKFETNGSGAAAAPKYRLTITTQETLGGLIVNLHSLTSDAASLTLTANYSLTEIEGGKEVTKGTASATASYDRSQQRFANVRAARDAEIRAATVLADQIRTRVGIALLNQK